MENEKEKKKKIKVLISVSWLKLFHWKKTKVKYLLCDKKNNFVALQRWGSKSSQLPAKGFHYRIANTT